MLPIQPAAGDGSPLRILCLGAHSDDIEIGCGGTVLALAGGERPIEVCWVVLSSGTGREREARRSASIFLEGAAESTVVVKDFRNGYFPWIGAEIKDFFEELKGILTPDIVFTHFRDDRHQDHRVVSDLTWNTFRNHLVFEYEIPKFDGDLGRPNCFVPLSDDVADRKVEALMEVFATQRDKHWFDERTFRGLMRLRGMESCAESGYAEAFHVRKFVLGGVGRPTAEASQVTDTARALA